MKQIEREQTTIEQAIEHANKYSPFKVIFPVNSMADTLDAINAAIESQTGDNEPWFEDEKSLTNAVRDGFLSLHTDGFIVWADEH